MMADHARTAQALFAFEELDDDRFRIAPYPTNLLRLYGGQLSGQALAAAVRTVDDDRIVHSAHAYFGAPGLVDLPLDFRVHRDRDGRSFSSRRVEVSQQGRLVLTLSASFHVPEPGPSYGEPMPADLPPPERIVPLVDQVRALGDRLPERHRPVWADEGLIDWRPTEPFAFVDPIGDARVRDFWFRLRCPLPDAPGAQAAMLLYASDIQVLHTAMGPFGEPPASDYWQTSSLDHAIWFHDRFDVADWLLYRTRAVAGGHARALGSGRIFARDGRHVASVMQEGLTRLLTTPRVGRL